MVQRPKRLPIAIVVAWFAVVAAAFLIGFVDMARVAGEFPRTADDLLAMAQFGLIVAGFAAPFAFVVAVVFGIPVFWYWRRRGYQSPLAHLLAGSLLSVLAVFAFGIFNHFSMWFSGPDFDLAIWVIVVAGPVAALTGRAISR